MKETPVNTPWYLKIPFIFITILWCTFPVKLLAQPQQLVDSLKTVVDTTSDDSVKCVALSELSEIIRDDNVWPVYNQQLQDFCELKIKSLDKNDPNLAFFKRYLADAINNKGIIEYNQGKMDSARYYYYKSFEIRKEIRQTTGICYSLYNIGYTYYFQGDVDSTIQYWDRALVIAEENNDHKGVASIISSLASICNDQGQVLKAIGYLKRAIKLLTEMLPKYEGSIKVELHLRLGMAYANLGEIYYEYKDMENATYYNNLALQHFKTINDQQFLGYTLLNQTGIYLDMDSTQKAMNATSEALTFFRQLKENKGISLSYLNMGNIFEQTGKDDSALYYYSKAEQLQLEINDRKELTYTYNSFSKFYDQRGDKEKAEYYAQKVYEMASESDLLQEIKESTLILSRTQAAKGQFESAYNMLSQHLKLKDSLGTRENERLLISQKLEDEYEKQKIIDQQKRDHEHEIEQQKQQQQFEIIIALSVGSLVIIILLIIIYRRLRVTRKQKVIIEEQKYVVMEMNEELVQTNEELAAQRDQIEAQKHTIEAKHTEIQESIQYAKRIQEAILPSPHQIRNTLKNSFVLYLPKDVVAGDFYWLEPVNDTLYIAAADCTGHGVPGAMVSVVCSNALTKALLEEQVEDTGKLLDRTRELVVERLAGAEKGTQPDESIVKDGMDISLCSLKIYSGQISAQWSGANNPIYIIKHKDPENILEIKGDKQPVGHFHRSEPFTSHTIDLEPGDMLYLFSDGFADQFGGPKGKKLGYRKFRELLLTIHHLEMNEQQEQLDAFFHQWKGSEDQLDDVCVIGIRV